MMKLSIILLTSVFLLCLVSSKVRAADLEVTCRTDGCSPTSTAYFFSDTEVWTPGKTISRSFKFNNESGVDKKVAVRSANKTGKGNLDMVLDLFINRQGESSTIWAGSINKFLSEGSVTMDSVGNNESEEFEFTVTFDPQSGNIYQGSTLSFDLIFSYTGPPAQQIPSETPVPASGDTGGGGTGQTTAGIISSVTAAIFTPKEFIVPVVIETEDTPGGVTTSLPEVAGMGTAVEKPLDKCKPSWWWILLPIIQAAACLLFFRKCNINNLKIKTGSLLGVYLLTNLVIYSYFCLNIIYSIWLTTGVLYLSMLKIKRSFNKSATFI